MEIERKLFVGGFSRETDEGILRNYFSNFGEVEHVLILVDKGTGHSKGFGFVTFSQSSMAEQALATQNHAILCRKVDVKPARPRGQREEHGGSGNNLNQHQHGVRKIFVGGLPDNLTIAEFKAYFEGFGSVQDTVMMHDADGRPRGFGFITFDSEVAANTVLQTSFHELKNKRVEVKKAEPKESLIQGYDFFSNRLHGLYGNSFPWERCFLDTYRPTLPCYGLPISHPSQASQCYGPPVYSYGAPFFGHWDAPYMVNPSGSSPIRVGTRSSVKVTISSPNVSSAVGISSCDKNEASSAVESSSMGSGSVEDAPGESCSTSDTDDEDSVYERNETEVDGNCSSSDDADGTLDSESANPVPDMSHKAVIDRPLKMLVVRV